MIPFPLLITCCQTIEKQRITGCWSDDTEKKNGVPICFYELAKIVKCVEPYDDDTNHGDLNWLLVLNTIIAREAIKLIAEMTPSKTLYLGSKSRVKDQP